MRINSMSALLLLLIIPCGMVRPQVILPEQRGETGLRENVFGLGLAVGAATGLGLSFRHHLPSSWSYQITGGIIKAGDRLMYAIGAELQYDLARTPSSRFFTGGGVGHYYSGKSDGNELKAPGRLGLGIGGEFAASPGLHGSASLMFTYFTDGTILPLPQIAIHYYFY
jgi:hypothetical protein